MKRTERQKENTAVERFCSLEVPAKIRLCVDTGFADDYSSASVERLVREILGGGGQIMATTGDGVPFTLRLL